MDNTEKPKNVMYSTPFLFNCFMGFNIGLVQGIIGHPLDTIKTLAQNIIRINNGHLNYKTLYAGFSYSLMMSVLTNMSAFGIRNDPTLKDDKVNTMLNIKYGFLSGVINTPIVYYFDKRKIKKQTNNFIKEIRKEKPMSNVLTNIHDKLKMKMNGTLQYEYKLSPFPRGFSMTLMRECIGYSGYMGSFFYLRDKREWHPFFAGGVAGAVSWTSTYCIDVIKTRQMTQNSGIVDAVKQGKLWNGYGYCVSRAIIVNSITLYVYSYIEEKFVVVLD